MAVHFRKNRDIRVWPYRLTLWMAVAVVALAMLVQDYPISLGADEEHSPGIELTRESDADIAVVVDYDAIRDSGDTFSERDFSAAWIALLERHVGPTSVATPATLSESLLDDSRLLILSHSVSTEIPESMLRHIREYVLDGATLVVERPEGQTREMFSADGDAGRRSGQAVTHAEGMDETFGARLEEMPILADYIGSTSPRDGAETLLAIDGAPVIYATDFGSGTVITVDFDIGRQLVSLHQGVPSDDFAVGDDDSPRPPRTDDLVADDELRGARVPYATLLERFVVYGVFASHAAIPSIWPFPGDADGAVLFAHQDSELGDGGFWPLELERQRGGSSTLLSSIDAGLSGEGAEQIRDDGGDIGLAWRPAHPSVALFESVGIAGWEPFRRPVDLEEQIDAIDDVLASGSVSTARTLDGVWTPQWTSALSMLAAGGVSTDVSFETPSHRGYSFGSGLPFHTLDDRGMPLGVRQYPVVVPVDADQGPDIEQLLADSADGHHQVLTVITRPADFAEYPDMDRFEDWLESFDHIDAHDHVMSNIADFEHYQRTRRHTTLRSRFDDDSTLPEELQSAETAPAHRAKLLRMTVDSDRDGMRLVIPHRVGDAEFFAARRGTERVGEQIVTDELETESITIAGFSLRRARLQSGFNNLEFYYR